MNSRRVLLLGVSLFVILSANPNSFAKQDKSIRLVVRGDDIGSCHAANIACIRAYKEGVMKSVELMVPCAWFPEAVKMLNENPGLDVGVHVTLTSEWDNVKWRPLTSAPSLTDADGYFYPTIWRRRGAPAGTALQEAKWKIDEVEKEIRAQIELAKRKVPRISHLSFHMGCSDLDPKVNEVCEKLAKQYNLYIPSRGDMRAAGGFGNAKTAEERIGKFIEMLKGLKPGTYLFVEHPGLDSPEMRAIGHPGYEDVAQDRQAVTDVFTSDRVKKAIDELGIKLLSYADLKNADKEITGTPDCQEVRAPRQQTPGEQRLPRCTTRAGLQDGLAAYLRLDETTGTLAADASGNGHDGNLMLSLTL